MHANQDASSSKGVKKDLNIIGSMQKSIPNASIPEIEGPEAVGLVDFTSNHKLSIEAAAEWLGNEVRVKGKPANVIDVVARFEGSEGYRLDLLLLQDLINAQPLQFWTSALGTHLLSKNTFIAYEVVEARLSFQFRSKGGIGVDLRTNIPGNPVELSAGAAFQWKNTATLEMKKLQVVAVELAKWDRKRKMLIPQ